MKKGKLIICFLNGFDLIIERAKQMLAGYFFREYVKTILLSLLIIFISYQLGKRIALGHIRTIIVFMIFLLLIAASANIRTGLIAIIAYLPFMAFIRRYIYLYGRYVAFDPILVISDVVTIWIFGYLILFRGKEIYRMYKESSFVKIATILLFIFILQVFNPLQGSILVGIGGAKFLIIPFLWFYFGLFIDKKFVNKLLYVIVILGTIAAIYGLKQTFFGFTSFENYWIEYGGYSALHLYRIIRSFSTFSSAGEYAHFLTISGIICLCLLLKSRRNIILLIGLLIMLSALFIAAVRSAIVIFIFSGILIVGFLVKNRRKGILIFAILSVLVIVFISRSEFEPTVNISDPLSVTTHHAVRGITNPLGESSFQSRFNSWFIVFPKLIISNPMGYGIGSISLAGWKFGGIQKVVENPLLDIFLGIGVIGGICFIILLILFYARCFQLIKQDESILFPIIGISISPVYFILGAFGEYSTAPIVWFIFGFIAKLYNNAAFERKNKKSHE